MTAVLRPIAGACALVGIASVIGLVSNALRMDGLPLVRKPLSETRAVVRREQLVGRSPINMPPRTTIDPHPAVQESKPVSPPIEETNPKTTVEKTGEQSRLHHPAKAAEPISPRPVPQSATPHVVGKSTKPPAKKIQALFTSLKDAWECFNNKNAIFLDARPEEDYNAEHIVGALCLAYESVDDDYDKVLGKISKDQLLITYCSDQECASAIKLADALVARGHTRVVIMLEGLPGWKDAGYPAVSGQKAGG